MMLSAVIVAKNAQRTIRRAIESLNFCDEVIVIVDADTKDSTTQEAQVCGARVLIKKWNGYGHQKNIGLEHALGEWVLFIDADEEVTLELAQEIVHTLQAPKKKFYWIRVITIFLDRPLKHLYGHNPRLFRKSEGRWTTQYVHEQVTRVSMSSRTDRRSDPGSGEDSYNDIIYLGDKHSAVLKHPLIHHSHKTIRSYINKMHQYTSLDAQQMAVSGMHRSGRAIHQSFLLPFELAFRQFIKLFLYRHGVLDGWAGWVWCVLSAYYEWEMAKKYNSKVKSQKSKLQLKT